MTRIYTYGGLFDRGRSTIGATGSGDLATIATGRLGGTLISLTYGRRLGGISDFLINRSRAISGLTFLTGNFRRYVSFKSTTIGGRGVSSSGLRGGRITRGYHFGFFVCRDISTMFCGGYFTQVFLSVKRYLCGCLNSL